MLVITTLLANLSMKTKAKKKNEAWLETKRLSTCDDSKDYAKAMRETKRYNVLTLKIRDQLHAYRDAVNLLMPERQLKSVTFRVLPVEAGGLRREIKFSVRHAR